MNRPVDDSFAVFEMLIWWDSHKQNCGSKSKPVGSKPNLSRVDAGAELTE